MPKYIHIYMPGKKQDQKNIRDQVSCSSHFVLNWVSKRTIGLTIFGILLCMLCVSLLDLAATLMIPGYGTLSVVSSALSRN